MARSTCVSYYSTYVPQGTATEQGNSTAHACHMGGAKLNPCHLWQHILRGKMPERICAQDPGNSL